MASSSSQMSAMEKLLKLIMGSDEFSRLSGAYDPMTDVPEVSSPTAEMYMNSANPDLQEVFSGLASGQLDSITAKQQLSDLADKGMFGSLPPAQLFSSVDKVVTEMNTPAKPKTDKYSKAGLPNPLETFTAESAPVLPKAEKKIKSSKAMEALAAKAINALQPASGLKPGTEVDKLSALPSWISASIENLDPKYYAAAKADLAKQQAYQQRVQSDLLKSNAAKLTQAGRTPYTEATGKNAALLSMLFGK